MIIFILEKKLCCSKEDCCNSHFLIVIYRLVLSAICLLIAPRLWQIDCYSSEDIWRCICDLNNSDEEFAKTVVFHLLIETYSIVDVVTSKHLSQPTWLVRVPANGDEYIILFFRCIQWLNSYLWKFPMMYRRFVSCFSARYFGTAEEKFSQDWQQIYCDSRWTVKWCSVYISL